MSRTGVDRGALPVTSWQPILDGALLRRARSTLARLADRLAVDDEVHARGSDRMPKRAAILVGFPGQALAHAYLAHAGFGDIHAERAEVLLERGVAEIGDLLNGDLIRGYSGTAFALEHLAGDPGDPDDANAHVDAELGREIANMELTPEYMTGLAGRAVYARERMSRPSGAALYAAIAQRLVDAARDGHWQTDPDGVVPNGDLRIAWGNAGIVPVLAACPLPAARATALAAMQRIWSQRRPSGSFYPLAKGQDRFGWCVGDVGLAGVMLAASRSLDATAWQSRWTEVLCACASQRPEPADNIVFCHGAAGIAHIYARAYHATGEATLQASATRWYELILDRLETEQQHWVSLLDGLSGVALVLAAATSDVEPAWDRLFLLS